MKLFKTALAFALVVLVVSPLSAQIRKSGITGAAFLKIGVGARAVALGSAYTTVTGDVNQMFWNPAGIALDARRTQVTMSYNSWIADLGHYAVAASRDFGDWGTLGIGVVGLGLSGIDNSGGADRDQIPAFLDNVYTGFRDNNTGSYDYQDLALQLSWARRFTDKLTLGATGKMISQNIDEVSATSFAVDFGAIYRIGYRGASIGARINNLGSDLEFYDVGAPLPLAFSIGASIDLLEQTDQGMKVTLLTDATKPQDGEQLLFAATEVQVMKVLKLRTGYKFNYSGIEDKKVDEVTGVRFDAPRTEEGLTFGAGVDVGMSGYNATIDYAFTDFGILDSVHRFSLRMDF